MCFIAFPWCFNALGLPSSIVIVVSPLKVLLEDLVKLAYVETMLHYIMFQRWLPIMKRVLPQHISEDSSKEMKLDAASG